MEASFSTGRRRTLEYRSIPIYRRVLEGQCEKELAFAHADLNVERICILKDGLSKGAAKLFRIF